MFLPVDRSMMVSAPQRVAQTILSTSSAIDDVTAELPMFALTLTANALPMIIGSLLGWVWFARGTAGAGALQLGAAVADHPGPRRQPGLHIDHRVRVGVGPGGVVEVEVLSGRQVHPPEWHSRAPVQLAIGLAAARDGPGGHGRFDGDCHAFISLRRHYPVRFVRSTTPSRPLSALGVRSRACLIWFGQMARPRRYPHSDRSVAGG